MKEFLSITIIIICFSFSCNAQIGIRAGLNYTSYSLDVFGEKAEVDSKVGFHFGGIYDLIIDDNSDVRVGAIFSTKGFKLDESDQNSVAKLTLKTAHIDIPVSYVYYLKDKMKGLYFEGGLVPSLLLSANTETTLAFAGEPEETNSRDVKEDFPSFDAALSLGLGYRIQKSISLGINYSLGILNQVKDADEDESATNRVASLHVIYHL